MTMAVASYCELRPIPITSPSLDSLFYSKSKAFIERPSFIGCVELYCGDAKAFSGCECIHNQFPSQTLPPVLMRSKDHANPCQAHSIRQKRRCRNYALSILNTTASIP